MKKFTKLCSLTMAGAMALSLAACGSKPAASSAATAEGSTSTAASTGTAAGDITTLKIITVGNGMPTNYDAWAKQVNDYLGEKIGVNVSVEVVSWGDWDQRRNVIVNTSGDYDIMFTNSNTYSNDVTTGAFMDITELLPTVAPDLYAMLPEDYWDACRINGQIYAVPTYKDSSQSEFIVWDKDAADATGIDVSKINTLEGLTEPLQKITDEKGEAAFPLNKSGANYLGFEYDMMNAGLIAMGVRYDDTEAKVVPVYEQEDVMSRLKLFHQWYQSGIINSDAATKPEENAYKACNIAQGWAGAAETTWGPNMGVTAVAYKWGPTIVSNDTVRGSLNCISSNCKAPEKALEFLQTLNTDPYTRDLFYYGVDGDNWQYSDDTKTKVHKNNSDWTMAGYTQASFFTVTPTDDVEFNQWDEVKELNEGAEPSVLIGFTLNTKDFSDQLANCISIAERYKGEILTGTSDPETAVPALMAELRAAGFDDIQAAAQEQVDAFMATKATTESAK